MRLQRFCTLLITIPLITIAAGSAPWAKNTENPPFPFARVPVVRAPTAGKAMTPSVPMEDGNGAPADIFYSPPEDQLPLSAGAETLSKRKSSCITTQDIRSADVRDDRTIRLTLGRGKQVDMKLRGTCFGLAFDESFYYQPGPSMQLCERFDTIVARSGSRCLIDAFVPVTAAAKK